MQDPPGIEKPALVFIGKGRPGEQNIIFTRNNPDFRQDPVIHTLYLEPESNKKLVTLFPGRKVYTVDYNPEIDGFKFSVGIDTKTTAGNYVKSALSYRLFDKDKAIEQFEYEKLATVPQLRNEAIYRAGKLLADMNKYDEAHDVMVYLAQNTDDEYYGQKAIVWAEYYEKNFISGSD